MSESEELVVKRFYRDLVANGRIEAVGEILSSDFVDHSLETADKGPEAFSDLLRQFDSAFRNRLVVIDELGVDDEYVSVRWIAGLTHSGPFMGFEPSGEALELSGVDVFRVRAGRITDHWEHEVGLGLRDQLELLARRSEARLRLEGAVEDVASWHDGMRAVTQTA
jgi:predicted SnoaL-like aldol condensation-catalyzing enzyme